MPSLLFGEAQQPAAGQDFTWFIYGSSLDSRAFAAWAEEHGHRVPDFSAARPARLHGWRLSFDVASRFWGGAVASLAESPGSFVEGLALPLPGSARGLVDHREGAASGLYVPLEVTVAPLDGGPPRMALAYRSSPSRRLPEAPPAPTYLDTLLAGARASGLSAEWIARLESLRR
jgi:gamma-glutamylcyclotransferase